MDSLLVGRSSATLKHLEPLFSDQVSLFDQSAVEIFSRNANWRTLWSAANVNALAERMKW